MMHNCGHELDYSVYIFVIDNSLPSRYIWLSYHMAENTLAKIVRDSKPTLQVPNKIYSGTSFTVKSFAN
jgi:hypothetical protein